MSQPIDLHSHSTASDGSLSPAELVSRAHALGVRVLALTDHDTLAGIPEASTRARQLGMSLIPGVEISVTWGKQTLHVVGLGVALDNKALNQGLAVLRDFRVWRADEIGRRLLRDAGIADATAGARQFAKGGLVSRTHFAHFLIAQGKAEHSREVFKRFLVSGKPGHVPGQWATLEQALGWIGAAGGQAVLAHPARYKLGYGKLRALCQEFKRLGGVGIEVVSGSQDANEAQELARLAQQLGLLASSGSDYHGPESPWQELGALPPLPGICTPLWHDWPEALAA
jgi:predicted metal-dependent phosphoesterase TrpH